MTTRGTVRGALVGIATVVAERGVAFVVVLALARLLSQAEFGRYGYLLAGVSLVQVIADQGLEVAGVARIAAAPGDAGVVVAAVLVWRVVLWTCVALPVGIVLPQLAPAADPVPLAAGVAASLVALLGASATVRGARRARGEMTAMARVALADAIVGGLAIVAVVSAGGGVEGVFLARAIASGVVTTVALAFGRERPRFIHVPAAMRQLASVATPLGANALLIALQTRAGHLVGMAVGGADLVAMLAAAARATEVLGVLPEGALLALFPRMAAEPERAIAIARDAAHRLGVLVLALVCAIAVAAPAVGVTLFGGRYGPAAPAIEILAWGALFTTTGGVALHAITALGRQRALVVANLVAAATGVGLQLALVPRLGLRGAALATLGTAACGQAVLMLHPATAPVVRAVWSRVALPLAIAALVVAGGSAFRRDLAGGAIASGAFVVAAHATGIVRRADWRALVAALTSPS